MIVIVFSGVVVKTEVLDTDYNKAGELWESLASSTNKIALPT